MSSGWHNKLARLFHADWKEIRTRTGQELHKRSDFFRYRLGWKPGAVRLSGGSPAAASAAATFLGQAASHKFFFERSEAAERAELVRKYLPGQAEAIVREADEICRHRFRLLGFEDLDYGSEIDWHLDRVHGMRAPVEPWFKIPFLDFAVVGDHKVTWELNRHQHLVTLAKAWLLTKDEKYVRELMAEWRSWVEANPYPLGINWASTLEVAFRSLSWIWVDHLLADAPGFPEFRAELLPALAFHGRYIECYLSTYFSPNTHLLGEAMALFFIGTLYPQFVRAPRWKDEGWKTLLHEARRQVRPDGVYFEQSLYYHVYALDFFLHARLLAARNGIEIPAAYDDVVRGMLGVVEALAQAGPAEGFGDDDGGRLFDPRRNRTEFMTDPLALGVFAYDYQGASAATLTEESIWPFGGRAVSTLPKTRPLLGLGSTVFPDGGLYVLVGVDPCPQAMLIDAGPQGIGRCGHGHADSLSLRLSMNGSRWLVDSGSGVYISSDPTPRNAFRGTAAHNTICVDGVDQAVPEEPFSWTNIPTTRVESWMTERTFIYFAASHNGYERLPDPVTHRRSVLRLHDGSGGSGIWLVRDVTLGASEHALELNWHFAPDLVVREAGATEFVALRPGAETSGLRLIVPNQREWSASMVQGRISPAYGRFETGPVLQCAARVKLPNEFATALVAESGVGEPEANRSRAAMTSTRQAAVQIYELHHDFENYAFCFARDKQPWSAGPWSSDAEVLCCRIEHEKLQQLIVIGGSSVSWQGEPLLNAGAPFQFFEWRRHDGLINSEREKFSTTPAFQELISSQHFPSSVLHPTSTYAEKH